MVPRAVRKLTIFFLIEDVKISVFYGASIMPRLEAGSDKRSETLRLANANEL